VDLDFFDRLHIDGFFRIEQDGIRFLIVRRHWDVSQCVHPGRRIAGTRRSQCGKRKEACEQQNAKEPHFNSRRWPFLAAG
jgi:hypothetical protein